MSGTIIGHHENKYESRNPLARWLVNNFLSDLGELYRLAHPAGKRVLEVGAGEGALAMHFVRAVRPAEYVATDLTLERMQADLDPCVRVETASAYELPYPNRSFDLVICCEVLEHLDNPERGLAECARVAREHVLLSTPWEPVWRAMNVARGKYLRSLGNTPGHVQHFSRGRLEALAALHLRLLAMRTPLPWTAILGKPILEA